MNIQAHKCHSCKRAFQPSKIDQKYCGPKCRQAAYRKRQMTAKRTKRTQPEPALIPAACLHCSGTFWAHSNRAQFCSTSCRTLHHRALKASIPQALMILYGLPIDKAQDVAETQPIAKIRSILVTAGYSYSHQERRWVRAV